MQSPIRALCVGIAAAGLAVGLAGTAGAQEYHLRISLETSPNHSRNKSMEQFVDALNEKSGGKIKAEIFPSAQLGPDRDMPKKLAAGNIEMGAVGPWLISAIEPTSDLTALPAFYGLGREATYQIVDGEIGQDLNAIIEKKLRVKLVGKWLDLGFANTYTRTKQIKTHADMAGLKIRIPGGPINTNVYRTFDANPTVIPWPDLPLALIRGTVDGAQTTSESVRSAKLWDSGIKYAFEEKQTLFQYVPMISKVFWDKLPADLQQLVTDTWAERIDAMRDFAHERQAGARKELQEQGITFVVPTKDQLAAAREKLMEGQEALVKNLGIDADLARRATEMANEIVSSRS